MGDKRDAVMWRHFVNELEKARCHLLAFNNVSKRGWFTFLLSWCSFDFQHGLSRSDDMRRKERNLQTTFQIDVLNYHPRYDVSNCCTSCDRINE